MKDELLGTGKQVNKFINIQLDADQLAKITPDRKRKICITVKLAEEPTDWKTHDVVLDRFHGVMKNREVNYNSY